MSKKRYNKIPVFGILERNGTVLVEVVKDVTAESLLSMTVTSAALPKASDN